MPQLNKTGEIKLEDGVLVAYDRNKGVVAEIYVSADGLTIEQKVGKGEMILFSENDLPKLRFAVKQTDGKKHFKVGGISFNVIRSDDRCDEIAYITGATAEDSDYHGGDVRGQLEVFIRPDTDYDNQQALVLTTAYADERFARDPRTGKRAIWGGMRNFLNHLWKFE